MIYECYQWIASVAPECKPPYLEIGSAQVQGPGASVRPLFGEPYVGLDMEAGPGVDVVSDFEKEGWYRAGPDRFNTVICTETLEHLKNPTKAVSRLYDALNPGGTCLITVPFAWFPHGFPDDYWRIAPAGLAEIMVKAGFEDIEVMRGGTPLKVLWDEGRMEQEPFSQVVWSHTLCKAKRGICGSH